MNPLDIIQSFPTAIWTVPLGVLAFFWMLTIVGMFDVESFDLDWDLEPDVEFEVDADVEVDADLHAGHAHGVFHSAAQALALGTVPLTVVLSSIVSSGWFMSVSAELLFADALRAVVGPWVYGIGMFVATFLVAIWLTTHVVRPLKPMFKTYTQHEGVSIIGQLVTITSSTVTQTFGTAIGKAADGTPLNLNVICDQTNAMTVGDEATIVSYDENDRSYVIYPIDPTKTGSVQLESPGAEERLPSDLTDGSERVSDSAATDRNHP